MIRRPPRSTQSRSSAASDVYKRQKHNTLTLQEQQAKLQAEKRKQEELKRKQYESQFGGSQAWEGLGSRGQSATPPVTSRSTTPATRPLPSNFARASSPAINGSSTPANGDDDDLFAAFNADTKVDNASYYPPPSVPSSGRNTPGFGASKPPDLTKPQAWEQSGSLGADLGDDDLSLIHI